MAPPGEVRLEEDLSAFDALEMVPQRRAGILRRAWPATWPKLAAIAIVVLSWQVVVWTHWRPAYVLPGPGEVFGRLLDDLGTSDLRTAILITLRRAAVGYAIALVIGAVVGLAVARLRVLRSAIGALITGLQTMPSIAWFPLAILLFKLSEGAILFVVVLGAAPAIANGVISGVDHIPPVLLRAGRVMGARGLSAYRHVIVPAALPGFVGGLKQGWAFAWRSLMAGELLVIIAAQPSLGVRLQLSREFADAPGLLASMVVILVIGIAVDGLVFGRLERIIRTRWGLVDTASAN